MKEFFWGILTSLLSTVIIGAITRIYVGHKGFMGVKQMICLIKDCSKAGIINIFPNRSSYINHKEHGTSSQYIHNNCSHEFLYIGFWLANGIEIGSIIEELKNMVNNNIKVTVIFVNIKNELLIKNISTNMSISTDELINRIEQSLSRLETMKEQLPDELKKYLEIRVHNIPITASAFLLDYNDSSKCKILVDYKMYGLSREESYGIEYSDISKEITRKMLKSFLLIKDRSVIFDETKQ